MERMKLTTAVLALVALFGLAGCEQRPATDTGADTQTMERGGGGAGGAAGSATDENAPGGMSSDRPSDMQSDQPGSMDSPSGSSPTR